MSSNEDDYDGDTPSGLLKKRRIQRACDICRRKKIRCDGVQMPGNRCSNCIAYSFDCTYVEAAKKRGPPKGYVESLEIRVEKLDKLLRRLVPDPTAFKELSDSLDNDSWPTERPRPSDPSSLVAHAGGVGSAYEAYCRHTPSHALASVTSAIRGGSCDMTPPKGPDEDDSTLILADNLKRLAIDPNEYRFFGKSSGAMLIQTAIELKHEYTQSEGTPELPLPKAILGGKRAEFWTLRPWERAHHKPPTPVYNFPEADLGNELIELYFANVNLFLPLLHRPTFERSVSDGLHFVDTNFAAIFLLVCAVGARFSDDPRARLDGVDSHHSCGWKWFDQVQMVRKSLLAPPSLYDLQFYCLSVQFLQGSSAPQSCWTMVGIGIRLAQDVGAHRRKVHTHTLTVEDELWKRAFWVMVCIDRMVSAALGRPCAIQDEDFDLDLPVECDDEYWENPDPEKRFKQPPNKPSTVTAFILSLKLNQVLAFSLRTIYSINKSKILLGFVGQQWEQHIVAELDSALNKWVDSVPDHLRWDPNREDDTFFNQSVALYASYYHIQILIHRPFIPSPSKPSPLSFPSLAICTNAARSCSHIVDIHRRRKLVPLAPQVQVCFELNFAMPVFTAGIVLLLSIWGGKRSGLSTDPNKEMADVHKCMQVLRMSEQRWHSAGRLWDILYELASVGDLPLPQPSPPSTNKRERDADTPMSATPTSPQTPMPQDEGPRNIAGSRRVTKDASGMRSMSGQQSQPQQQQHKQQPQPSTSMSSSSHSAQPKQEPSPLLSTTTTELYPLPVYSNELGRLPLHGQLNFSTPAQVNHANYWYPPVPSNGSGSGQSSTSSDPIPLPSSSTSSSSSFSHPLHGQQQHQQHLSQNHSSSLNTHISNGYSHPPEMSTMTQGYGMGDPSMMFDPMAFTLGAPASFGMSSMDGHGGRASSSAVPNDMSGSYRGVSMDLGGGQAGQSEQQSQQLHQQTQNLQQQQLNNAYVDSDMIAMWSNAPAGFELDEWGTYLSNVSELTQGNQHGTAMHGQG
ncbi:fungal-specific transcription factor domain-containing protein [Crassisporium funariophilum]|nr:fungal-specific transcription factor domain-containing protein [Crassisporium funariophilum]